MSSPFAHVSVPTFSSAEDASAWADLEASYLAEGRVTDLHECLLQAAESHLSKERGAQLATRAARLALIDGEEDYDRAKVALDMAVSLDPSCESAWKLAAEVAAGKGDLLDAAECYVRLAWLDGDQFGRARLLLQAGDAFRKMAALEDDQRAQPSMRKAREVYKAAIRAIPPGQASGSVVKKVLLDAGRVDSLMQLLDTEPREGTGEPPAIERADMHLLRGRLLVADPNRRVEAVSHLVASVECADGPGRVALEVLGGLHGLAEGWRDMVTSMEREAGKLEADDPPRAANLLRRVVRACLDQPVDLPRAEATLRRLTALDPEDAASAECLTSILASAGRHRDAIQLLADLAEIATSKTASLYLMRAGVLELARFGERGASLRLFEAALERDRNSRAAATHLKEAYRDSGRWRDLARVMVAEVEGREVDGRVLDAWREAGRLLRDRAADVVAASDVYRRIIRQDPTDEDAILFFQEFHERVDREAAVVESHRETAAEAPSTLERVAALIRASEAALRLGSLPRARALLEEARGHAPEDSELLRRLVDLQVEHGDHLSACELLQAEAGRLGEAHPDWPETALRLARLLLRSLGEVARARPYLDALSSLDAPEASEARAEVEKLNRDLGAAGLAAAWTGAEDVVSDTQIEGSELLLMLPARQALEKGEVGSALSLASAVAARYPLSTDLGLEARELVADLLIDHLKDLSAGLEKLAEIGRDRTLPPRVRRRINESRLRLLERDTTSSLARDRALADALLDAAAVADTRERAFELRYRAGRALSSRSETWREGAFVLNELLLDDQESLPVLQALKETYLREGQWLLLGDVLWKLAEGTPREQAVPYYHELADLAVTAANDAAMAVRALRRSLERVPGQRPVMEALVDYAARAGDQEAEIAALRALIATEEDHDRLPDLQLALAASLSKAGRPEEAVLVCGRVAELHPESLEAWCALERAATSAGNAREMLRALKGQAEATLDRIESARLLAEAGQRSLDELGESEGAESFMAMALARDPANEQAVSLLMKLLDRGVVGLEKATELLRRAAEDADEPERRADLWCRLAILYSGRLDDEDSARLSYGRAMRHLPGHAPALAGLGRLLLDSGDIEAASPLLEELARHADAPESARAWATVELARIALVVGQEARATELLESAVELDPSDASAHVLRGKLALRQRRYEDAIQSLSAAAAIGEQGAFGAPVGSELTDLHAALGQAWQGLGRHREAERAWQRALSRDALHEGALSALAAIAVSNGEWTVAAEMKERLAELLPDSKTRALALAEVGVMLRDQSSDPRAALEVFRKAASLDMENLPVQASILALARRLGRPGEAKDAALLCSRQAASPNAAAEYLAVAGDCAEAEGDSRGALDLARAALEIDPTCETALQRAVEMLELTGSRVEAAELLGRAASRTRDGALRRRFAVGRARLLEDAGQDSAAAACLARAVADAPDDGALLLAVAACVAPPLDDAKAAMTALLPGLSRHPLEVPRLAAVASLASHTGQVDRAYVCGALLSVVRAHLPGGEIWTEKLREALPGKLEGTLPEPLASEILPPELKLGEPFYRAAEATILTTQAERRPFGWHIPETRVPHPMWVEELRLVAGALRLPPQQELRSGPAGSGIRLAPDRGRLIVAEDLLDVRHPGQRRFTLAFGLALSVPGRRWVAASGNPEVTMDRLLSWSKGFADADTALELGELLGLGRHQLLASHAGPQVPIAKKFMDSAVVAATRLGLLAAADVAEGLEAALKLLAPGRDLPRDVASLAATGRVHPALADVLAFVHSSEFLAGRRALGLSVACTT